MYSTIVGMPPANHIHIIKRIAREWDYVYDMQQLLETVLKFQTKFKTYQNTSHNPHLR